MTQLLDTSSPNFDGQFERLLGAKRDTEAGVDQTVRDIVEAVRQRGDEALFNYTAEFDRVQWTPETVRVGPEEILEAREAVSQDTLDALEKAAQRIRTYHQHQLPEDLRYVDDEGVELGYRWTPIASVGLYVPGGTAAYPSSVLMNAVPAVVGGVERVIMVVPTPDGTLNPNVLAAASTAGVGEIYKIGGAQAVAALAYGTQSIPKVDKVVGPGNAYVAAAKRQLFGTIGIDLIAGPSEILVIADGKSDASWVAADLLSQAEHDPNAQSILITDDRSLAEAVAERLEEQLEVLPRNDIARASWEQFGAIIIADDLTAAAALADRIAPEHLELSVEDPESLLQLIHHAGAVFLGRYTPEAIGDYVAGPNHVLPTSGSARFASGLSVLDFMKRTSLIKCSEDSFKTLAQSAEHLADLEGLTAHALSMRIRRSKN